MIIGYCIEAFRAVDFRKQKDLEPERGILLNVKVYISPTFLYYTNYLLNEIAWCTIANMQSTFWRIQ